MSKTALVTGSSGLIGSEAVRFLDERGWAVHGVDNNMRREFFGEHGDTTWNLERLLRETSRFEHHGLDIRDRDGVARLFAERRLDLVFHCAAQPSHDLAASRPFDDFEINALATLNLLEAARAHCPETPFVFMSTNKVYGDAPNELPLVELETRWDYADGARRHRRDDADRRVDALALRRLEGRRRRDGAGVRALLRHADRVLPRRLPHRAARTPAPSCTASSRTSRGRSARAGRTGSSATAASRCGTTSTPTTSARR